MCAHLIDFQFHVNAVISTRSSAETPPTPAPPTSPDHTLWRQLGDGSSRGVGGRGRKREVVTTIEMPDDGELLECVLQNWLREVFGSLELVHAMLLCDTCTTCFKVCTHGFSSVNLGVDVLCWLTGMAKWLSTILQLSPSGSRHFITGLDPGA